MKTDFYNKDMFFGADSGTLRIAGILRKNMTIAERILWKKLRDRNLFNTKFRRQHPIEILIVDFYCHKYRLAIEIDGEIHNNKEKQEYDLNRTAELKRFGISVIRFTNYQIVYEIDQVITKIQETIID